MKIIHMYGRSFPEHYKGEIVSKKYPADKLRKLEAAHQKLMAQLLVHAQQLKYPSEFPPYVEFAQHFIFSLGLSSDPAFQFLSKWFQQPDGAAPLLNIYAKFIHARSGKPIFQVANDLAVALHNTDMPDEPTASIKAPFEGMLIVVPPNVFTNPEVSEVYCALTPGDRLRVVFSTADRYIFCSLELLEDYNLEAAIKENLSRYGEYECPPEFHAEAFRFTINLLLYLASENAQVEKKSQPELHALHQKVAQAKGSRKEELQKKLLALKRKIYIVGGGFRLAPEYTAQLTEEGKRWVLTHRFRVRGHYKNQRYGKGLEEVKRIYVSPYWKGPDMAEILERNYVVRES